MLKLFSFTLFNILTILLLLTKDALERLSWFLAVVGTNDCGLAGSVLIMTNIYINQFAVACIIFLMFTDTIKVSDCQRQLSVRRFFIFISADKYVCLHHFQADQIISFMCLQITKDPCILNFETLIYKSFCHNM